MARLRVYYDDTGLANYLFVDADEARTDKLRAHLDKYGIDVGGWGKATKVAPNGQQYPYYIRVMRGTLKGALRQALDSFRG